MAPVQSKSKAKGSESVKTTARKVTQAVKAAVDNVRAKRKKARTERTQDAIENGDDEVQFPSVSSRTGAVYCTSPATACLPPPSAACFVWDSGDAATCFG
ncbi:hypothetical protein B0H13DRAFT_2350321 [Mycena leptocephala]|nr:hypothetical protein B0H13DRAFT_2350321 [Mycena leptocephala]